MMKPSPVSVEQRRQTNITSALTPSKRPHHLSLSAKERKEKVGERISALQQLVSPYGKTDTASVLLETIEYINFLQEQVKVLSAPYLHPMSTSETTTSSQFEELIEYSYSSSLRSKGLCVVPISYTSGVCSSSNGADIWAPKTHLTRW